MKRPFLSTFAVFALSACDPVVEIDTTVRVSVGAQQTLVDFPQELVINSGSGPERVFVLCGPGDARDITVNRSTGWIGCAQAMEVSAWLSAFTPASGAELICGEQEDTRFVGAANPRPQPSDPSAREAIFQDTGEARFGGCSGGVAQVSLVIAVE